MNKQEQRKLLKALRKAMTAEEISLKNRRIAENFCSLPEFKAAKSVFIYISLPKEAGTFEIIEDAIRLGKTVLVPVTIEGIISLCHLKSTEKLIAGEFGISEPADKEMWQGTPDIAVIPGLGFDSYGGRMGFGKGCYDRFLAENDCVKIGLGFAEQMQEKIITEPHDVPMDIIVTERDVIYVIPPQKGE